MASEDIRTLIQEHHAFYEVLFYYVVVEERAEGEPVVTRRVHAGFDIDIFGERTKNDPTWTPPPEKYALGVAALRGIANTVSRKAADTCCVEVIPSPSTVVVDTRNQGRFEATCRLRISHRRGLDQPAGWPEQHALEEVMKELKSLGFVRRW